MCCTSNNPVFGTSLRIHVFGHDGRPRRRFTYIQFKEIQTHHTIDVTWDRSACMIEKYDHIWKGNHGNDVAKWWIYKHLQIWVWSMFRTKYRSILEFKCQKEKEIKWRMERVYLIIIKLKTEYPRISGSFFGVKCTS